MKHGYIGEFETIGAHVAGKVIVNHLTAQMIENDRTICSRPVSVASLFWQSHVAPWTMKKQDKNTQEGKSWGSFSGDVKHIIKVSTVGAQGQSFWTFPAEWQMSGSVDCADWWHLNQLRQSCWPHFHLSWGWGAVSSTGWLCLYHTTTKFPNRTKICQGFRGKTVFKSCQMRSNGSIRWL